MHFKQIVVGVDFSPNSKQAMKEALRLQRDAHTGVVAVHVVEKKLLGDIEKFLELGEEQVRAQSERCLEHWITELAGPNHNVCCEAVIAHPFEGLIHATERHHADLLILGSRGVMAGVGHPGAVASKCVRKADIDVLLVRRNHDGPFQRVVACVECNDTSVHAVECARRVAEADGAKCQMLHIHVPVALGSLALDPFPVETHSRWLESLDATAKADFEAFVKSVPSSEAGPEPVYRVAVSASDGIREFLQETSADLAVLGTRGRTGMRAMLLGTTAERLLHEVPCSLFVVKSKA